jgi:hypothetical protein
MSQQKTDNEWKVLCSYIDKRDPSDRLLRCLTAGETKILGLKGQCRLDRCHVIPRSISQQNIYNYKNVYKINRYSHNNLDHCQCPLTGKAINRNERDWWWWRIINKSTENFNSLVDYIFLIEKYINS